MNDNKAKSPADQFCDSVLKAMFDKNEGTFADREIVDKVVRPFYHVMDDAHERGDNAVDFCSAMESAVTMMISNFVTRVAGNNLEAAQDATQEIINNVALRLNENLVNEHKALQQTAEIIPLPTHPKNRSK